jgi:glycosyltransferase involved in cell wall biosynthesis
MRIGLDAIAAVGRGGNATYSYQLIRRLLAAKSADTYYLFSYLHDLLRPKFNERGARYAEVHSQLVASLFPLPRLQRINDALLRFGARMRRIDLFHFTNPLNYVEGPFKKVVTIHDLAPLHDASWTKERSGRLLMERLARIASADAIIAVSEFTKRDVVEKLDVPPERITVVYEGAGETFYPDPARDGIAELAGDSPYLLCVGQLQPRKNNLALIEAFASVAAEFADIKLVFAGRPVSGEYFQRLEAAVGGAALAGRVVFVHTADDHLLRRLYTHAECMVYPSLFEGFGLPVLESLQCGVPVITSTTSSLPEVAGEAGLLVDPHSLEGLAAAIRNYLSDDALRGRLRSAIPAQLAKFSWEKAAQETLKVYESLCR